MPEHPLLSQNIHPTNEPDQVMFLVRWSKQVKTRLVLHVGVLHETNRLVSDKRGVL